jgi:hypothetical protein
LEVEHERDRYLLISAADAMTLGELAVLASWRESLKALERDMHRLLESYGARAPEALATLDPEERRTIYSILGLRVKALPYKSLRVRGAFGEEDLVCHNDATSTR